MPSTPRADNAFSSIKEILQQSNQSRVANRTDSSFPLIKEILQQTKQSSVVNTTDSFFRQSTETEQTNKRKAVDNDCLSTVNASDAEFDSLASINLDIPADQLDAFIKELEADLCEPEQKKIKMESR